MIEWGLEWHRLDSYFEFKEITAPGTPEANGVRLYGKDSSGTSTLCYKNDAGTEICLPTSGSFVTGTGTANRLAYWSSSSVLAANAALTQNRVMFPDSNGLPTGSANLFWDNSNGFLGVGSSSPLHHLHVFYSTTGTRGVVSQNSVADVTSSVFSGRKVRGASTALSSGDSIVDFQGEGFDGSAFARGSILRMATAEAWTGSAHGTDLRIFTTAIGSTSLAERFRVGPSGQLGIGGATYGNSNAPFISQGSSAAPKWVANGAWDDANNVIGLNSTTPNTFTTVPGFFVQGNNSVVLQMQAFGTSATPVVLYKAGRGTMASPSALLAADNFFAFNCYGQYDTTVDHFNLSAQLVANTLENFDSTHAGSQWLFYTCPTASTTLKRRFSVGMNVVVGDAAAALATNATDGFLYIPTCAGTPTGTPTSITGVRPIVYDTTNNKLYVYNSGWKTTTVFA